MRLVISFISILLLINICSTFKFHSSNAVVTLNGKSYSGCQVDADSDQNAQQIVYSFGVTENEIFANKTRFQMCSSSCSAYIISYSLPNYALTGLTAVSTETVNSISCKKYVYTDASKYTVTIWAQASQLTRIVQVSQVANDATFSRTILFNTFDNTVSATITAPSNSQYPGCATSVQCGSALDLVLVVDISGSINSTEFDKEKTFLNDVINSFTIGTYGVHIGYVTFSTSATVVLQLSDSKSQIQTSIANTPTPNGNTNIGGAINAASSIFTSTGRGSSVPKVMMVLTDGAANEPGSPINPTQYMIDAAQTAKSNGIIIYAIGVGAEASTGNQLFQISSGIGYNVSVDDFSQLSTALKGLLQTVCLGGDNTACGVSCNNAQFCGCGSCICTKDSSMCGSRGTFNPTSCSCSCTGEWTNSGTIDCSVCGIVCTHGTKNSTDCSCKCPVNTLYEGTYCQNCPVTCTDHQTNLTNCQGCQCKNYWSGPDCTICDTTPGKYCANNGVVADLTTCSGCVCQNSYTASSGCTLCGLSCGKGKANSDCSACDCSGTYFTGPTCGSCSLDCHNGTVTSTSTCNSCKCNNYYSASSFCTSCISGYCKNGGSPGANCGACSCVGNWNGDTCTNCGLDCHNGTANSACNACTCTSGTFYTSASNCTVCDSTACGANGSPDSTCTSCNCHTNFTSSSNGKCDICVSGLCYGRGTPTSTSTCNSCTCNNATLATGTYCETCNYGYCKGGSMNSDCSGCNCKGGWQGDDCSKCTKANYALLDTVCLNNDVRAVCYPFYAFSTAVYDIGTVCYSLIDSDTLKMVFTITNLDWSMSRVGTSFQTNSIGSTTYSGQQYKKSFGSSVQYYSWTINLSSQIQSGATYNIFVVATVAPNGGSSTTAGIANVEQSNSATSVTTGTCQDCLCNYNCNNGTVNSNCNGCSSCPYPQTTSSNCAKCDTSKRDYCNNHGYPDADTCECVCDTNYGGPFCSECIFNCTRGTVTGCSTCTCPSNTGWTGPQCTNCDSNLLCNNRGNASDPSVCTSCDCNTPWGGSRCTQCNFDCHGHGSPVTSTCDHCTCNDPWSGVDCTECLASNLCHGRGTVDQVCTNCTCNFPWSGDRCTDCIYDCNGHGTNNPTCDGCICQGAYLVSSDCFICDTTVDCAYCNRHGNISNPDSGCNACDCKDYWGGDYCEQCSLNCHSGQYNSECTACVCPTGSYYTPESNCTVCELTCQNGGSPNSACTYCNCVDGWGTKDCSVCVDTNACVYASGMDIDNCTCICNDKWSGRHCDTCVYDSSLCGFPTNGYLQNTTINGVENCVCVCSAPWTGPDCAFCALLPEYGGVSCANDKQEKSYSDCSCHCPEYYADDETCITCIITPDVCGHPVIPNYVNMTACDCGECEGNWSGRNCSVCPIDSCPVGWAFNDTDCSCYVVCGNGIISEGEDCEVSLMAPKDEVCCTDCHFNTILCNDYNSCTFDDLCANGSCDGLSSIDWSVDQNRNVLVSGTTPSPSLFTRWGMTVYATNGNSAVLYNSSSDTSRSSLSFPNANPYGGSQTFGNILVLQNVVATDSICISFSTPMQLSVVSVLGVSLSGTTTTFKCPSSSYVHNNKVWTSVGGPGGVEYISVPCGDSGVSSICYNNLRTAAVGPLYTCDTSNLLLGAVGDYVWHDFNRDNIQDSFELGIPSAYVALLTSDYQTITSTRTDSSGLYLFDNLYAGDYIVQFVVPQGYVYSTPLNSCSTSTPICGRTNLFHLNGGQIDLTRDAGAYFSGQIGNFVWYDLNEDGLQSAAEGGVGDVQLNLYLNSDLNNVIATQKTDPNGYYEFTKLPIYKTANTYWQYIVEIVPPTGAILTAPYQGSDTNKDSNFDRTTYLSDAITIPLDTRVDNSIDGGIYYCCGSIGDFVWYDTNKDGLQGVNENGVANIPVTLLWNSKTYAQTQTNSSGYYLFDSLPIRSNYIVVFSLPNSSFIFTTQAAGSDRSKDSNPNADGVTPSITLTKSIPDVRDVDAGIVSGCQVASDCAASTNLCKSASCIKNECVYTTTVSCSSLPSDTCTYYECSPATGTCLLNVKDVSCNDGNICTSNDRCTINGCQGTPNSNSCSDGDACTSNDICTDGTCKGTPTTCSPPSNICQESICDSKLGCQVINKADNTACDDGNKCTDGDYCLSGSCTPGTPKTCSLPGQCTSISCNPSTGNCDTKILTSSSCNDNNACTISDVCASNGTCQGTPIVCSQAGLDQCHVNRCVGSLCKTFYNPVPCDDNNKCTTNDACSPSGCVGTPVVCPSSPCVLNTCDSATGTCKQTPDNTQSCTDNNPCTVDVCSNGACISTPIVCNDNNPCTDDTCINGKCQYLPNYNTCNDNNPCTTVDMCNALGKCVGQDIVCDDNNVCTTDSCVNGVCVFKNDNFVLCDDGNLCTQTSYCLDGQCQGFNELVCNDQNSCTNDACVDGVCTFTYNTNDCNDNDACTTNGKCVEGVCVSEPVVCEPVDNVCLLSVCANNKCQYQPDPSATTCDDSNPCTINDQCVAGVCEGTAKQCVSNDVCYSSRCNSITGECEVSPTTSSCNDNNPCTINDKCSNGVCAGTPLVCNDGNVCTNDTCVNGQCVYTPNTLSCNDNVPCTQNDVCSNGVCAGTPIVCEDYNVCTQESCNAVTGQCEFKYTDGVTCTDNNLCTTNDLCTKGKCVGTPVSCTNNTNVCVDYSCSPIDGQCHSSYNTKSCDDKDPCTSTSSCVEGVCVGVPIVCPTLSNRPCVDNVCVNGLCVPKVDDTNVCSDNLACTTDVCKNGLCVSSPSVTSCATEECTVDGDCTATDLCHTVSCVNNKCVNTQKVCTTGSNPCYDYFCDLASGECSQSPNSNTCDDGNVCTQTDVCVNGECKGYNILTCTSTNPCVASTCHPVDGCVRSLITDLETSCNDANDCTVNDVCDIDGICRGTQLNCNDLNVCTTDTCVAGVCVHTANTNVCSDGDACTINDYCANKVCNPGKQLNCDDNNACTDDSCVSGTCTHTQLSYTSCNDGLDCTIGDTCMGGTCIGGTVECNDNNECTEDSCGTDGKCVFTNLDGSYCSDNNLCTSDDTCVQGVCVGVSNCPPPGAEINECINYECTATGGCKVVYSSSSCSNTSNCFHSQGTCFNGLCLSEPLDCSSSNICKVGYCDEATGQCAYVNNNVSCAPTVTDKCHKYACVDLECTIVSTASCDDNDVCTRDACNPLSGACTHSPIIDTSLSCDDNNLCTINDVCSVNGCKGTEISCDDNNPCTDDSCDPISGCVNTFNNNTCVSEDLCVTEAICSLGECTPVTRTTCDELSCNTVQCNSATGVCEYTPNDALSCSDDNNCTNDECTAGSCISTPKVCSTSVVCQSSVCDSETGDCVNVANNTLTCDDSNPCTNDYCENGSCSSSPVSCADNELCSFDEQCSLIDGSCSSTPYSCLISPCIYLSCAGDGSCNFDKYVTNLVPTIYLSITTSSTTNTVQAYSLVDYKERYSVPLTDAVVSLDIQQNSGTVYAVTGAQMNTLASFVRNDDYELTNQTTTITTLSGPDFAITMKANFNSYTTPYNYNIDVYSGILTETFYEYSEDGRKGSFSPAPSDASIVSFDQHGRYLYYLRPGTTADSKTIYAWSSSTQTSYVLCPSSQLVDLPASVYAVSMDVNSLGNIFIGYNIPDSSLAVYVVTPLVSGCNVTKIPFAANFTSADKLNSLTVDDTTCNTKTIVVPPPVTPSNSPSPVPFVPPPVIPPPPPPPVAPVGGNLHGGSAGNSGNSVPAGSDSNLVLSDRTGYISTAVVGSIAGGTVLIAAIFGAVIGLNTSKEDKSVPLAAVLEAPEVSGVTNENPVFVPQVGAQSGAIYEAA